MNPREEIRALEQIVDELLDILQGMVQSGEDVPQELEDQIADVIEDSTNRIIEIQSGTGGTRGTPPVPPQSPIPVGSDLLWILAGGQEDAFVGYLNTFPDPALNALLQNPTQLSQVIEHLQRTMPTPGEQPSEDGIEHAPLNSSNIYGFRYDPRSGRLLVRFQSGSVYGYTGVPPGIFKVFQQGAVPAKTNGQNQFGKWWQGKIPSLGAAFYQLIRQGGYPYQRLR